MSAASRIAAAASPDAGMAQHFVERIFIARRTRGKAGACATCEQRRGLRETRGLGDGSDRFGGTR